MNTSSFQAKSSGFTLIEMLVVLAILALLMGAVSTGIVRAKEQAYKTRARDTARQICQAWNLYLMDNHKFPAASSLDSVKDGYVTGTKSLESLNGGKRYLEATEQEGDDDGLRDPWGSLFRFRLDEDYDGKIDNPVAGVEGLQSDSDVYGNVVAWSLGPGADKKSTLSGGEASYSDKDKKKWIVVYQ